MHCCVAGGGGNGFSFCAGENVADSFYANGYVANDFFIGIVAA